MASEISNTTVRLLTLAACALIAAFVPVCASAESTKTVDLDIRPGGVVATFTEAIVSYWKSNGFLSWGVVYRHTSKIRMQ